MMTFAEKTKTGESESVKLNGLKRKSNDLRADSINESAPLFGFPIQRKADCACGGGCSCCQSAGSNLAVSHPNDASEIEADRVADRVMRMPENQSYPHHSQVKALSESITPIVQTKSAGNSSITGELSHKISSSRGGGRNLDVNTQSFMQSRFGADFSDVKIHTDHEAVGMSRELKAKAFTIGSNIYFNDGQFEPNSASGRHLLAHELAHTIQQRNGVKSQRLIQRKSIDDFKTELEATSADHKKVIEELFKHPKFIPLVDYVRKCPAGTIDFQVKRLQQLVNGSLVDLFGGFSGSDLTVNPQRSEHATNPLEMVDTIVHELLHAILDKNSVCTSAANPFPLAADIQDRASDPELQALQAGSSSDIFNRTTAAGLSAAGSTTQSGTDLLEYFDANYGPSASGPETHYVDLNKAGLKLVVSIISDIRKKFPAIGKETVSFDNVELLEAATLLSTRDWVSTAQRTFSKDMFKAGVAAKRKIDASTFTDREYDISAIQVVESADSRIFDENADGHWGVSGGVWQCSKRSRFTGKRLNTYVTGTKSKKPGGSVNYKIIQHT